MYDSRTSVTFFGGQVMPPSQTGRVTSRSGPRGLRSRLRRRAWLETDCVANAPLLQLLHGKQLELARARFTQLDLPAHTELMHEGAQGRDFALLIDGHVEIQRHGDAINELDAGTYFGEGALLHELTHSNGCRSASVISLTPVRIAVCSDRDLHLLMKDSDEIRGELEWTATHRE